MKQIDAGVFYLDLRFYNQATRRDPRKEYAIAIHMNPRAIGSYLRYLLSFVSAPLYNSIQVFFEGKAIDRTRRKNRLLS